MALGFTFQVPSDPLGEVKPEVFPKESCKDSDERETVNSHLHMPRDVCQQEAVLRIQEPNLKKNI